MDSRSKAQLDKLSPEKRAKVEALIAKHATPEYRAKEQAAREAFDKEMRETGTIATVPREDVREIAPLLEGVGRALRERRQVGGLSLDDVAASSGIPRSAVARLERGDNPNPTVGTLARLAAALGGRIRIEFEASADPSAPVS